MTENQQEEQDFEKLIDYLKRTRNIDFSGYKTIGLKRRMRKRIQAVKMDSYGDYLDF